MLKASKTIHRYTVKSYECDSKDTLRLVTLFNMLQDIADDSTNALGMGYDYLRELGKAWIIISMDVEIERMPHLQEEIKVVSWPSNEGAVYTEREFEVWSESGERIIRACSQWIVIDYASRRPMPARRYLPEYETIPDRAIATNRFKKLPGIERTDYSEQFLVRYDDIDHNNHVNNSIYPLWASESLEPEYRMEHVPARVAINFKKEGLLGEKIAVCTQMNEDSSLHSIKSINDGRELARVRFEWQKRG